MDHWLQKVVTILQARTSDLRELAILAGGDPRTFYRGARMDGVDLSGQDLRGMEFTDLNSTSVKTDRDTVLDDPTALDPAQADAPSGDTESLAHTALLELRSSTRQERRLAIIFDTILSDVQVGKVLLDSYPFDSALFANRVIGNLRSILQHHDPVLVPAAVRREVYRALIDFYGLRKGELLLEFAERLGKYEEIHRMIKSKLDRSQSQFVMYYDKLIRQALLKSARHHQKGPESLPLFQQKQSNP